MLQSPDAVEITPLVGKPGASLVLASEAEGVALFDGWSAGGAWRTLLPWPEEIRQLGWDDAASWPRELEQLEASIVITADASLIDAPFLGGWAGFISYEAAATIEAAQPRDVHPPEPAMFFSRHRAGVVIDPRGNAFLFAPAGESQRYARLLSEHDGRTAAGPASAVTRGGDLRDSLQGDAYEQSVQRIREAICDGDVYQVNLTRVFSAPSRGDDAARLYNALTGANPPRSSAFLRTADCTIASASPEVLLRFDRAAGIAETRPIKGTVRREGDDAREIAALLASAKDAAEHLMIVDVARNDLGKVAPSGAVSVSEFRRVQTLANVHHLESTVRATGLAGRSAAEVLAALSPAASITGAPKRAAVQMIRELEPEARGVYCGSIGFIGARTVEMSVAIRTAITSADSVRYHAGGGIVWDSDAAAENDESHAKAAAFLQYVLHDSKERA